MNDLTVNQPSHPAAEPSVDAEARLLEAEAAALGISVARLVANRRNSLKSTGPKSESGKRRSSLNSYRSGLTGQIVCKTPEELEYYHKHLAEILAECQPVGASERFLSVSIADNMLRLNRIRQIEDGIFADGVRTRANAIDSGHPEVDTALAQSETFTEQAKSFSLLARYEQSIRKALREDREQLKLMQAERQTAHDQARQRAVELATLAEAKGETYTPGDDFEPASANGGFVFDYASLAAWTARQRRLYLAHDYYRSLGSPKPALDPVALEPETDPEAPEIDCAA